MKILVVYLAFVGLNVLLLMVLHMRPIWLVFPIDFVGGLALVGVRAYRS